MTPEQRHALLWLKLAMARGGLVARGLPPSTVEGRHIEAILRYTATDDAPTDELLQWAKGVIQQDAKKAFGRRPTLRGKAATQFLVDHGWRYNPLTGKWFSTRPEYTKAEALKLASKERACNKQCHLVFHMTGGYHRTDCDAYVKP